MTSRKPHPQQHGLVRVTIWLATVIVTSLVWVLVLRALGANQAWEMVLMGALNGAILLPLIVSRFR